MKSSVRRVRNTGQRPPVPLAPYGYRRGTMFSLSGGTASRESYMRAYGMSGTVFSIVSLLQQAAASPQWHLYKKQPQDGRRRYAQTDRGSDQRTEVISHAALKLWNQPNEFHSGFEFREGCNQHQELTGETFWVLNREGTTFPTAMWYVRPDRMDPVPSVDDYLLGWMYSGPNGEQVPLKLDEVIIEKLPDPLDPFRGAGPVASVMPNIQQQKFATDYQRNLFLNGADPGGVITVDKRLSDAEWDEFVARWREMHQGVARAGRVGILENGATWTNAGQTNKDLEYGNLRLANRDELREAWRMHKAMLGTVEDVNRANAQTAEEVFVGWQTVPRLNRRRDTLNFKLLPMFGDDSVEFDYEDPSPENREEDNSELVAKTAAAQTLVAAGFDADDVLEVVGLPSMHWTAPAQPAQPDERDNPSAGRLAIGDHLGRESLTLTNRKDAKAKVFAQQAEDYPAEAMAWMHHADWIGPVKVPLDHIEPQIKWMDGADPEHVQDFVKKLRNGKKLKPLILVKTPGNPKLQLIDGHHRYLASAEMDEPPRAFIGTVGQDHGPWESMHDYQHPTGHKGGAAASLNLAAGTDLAALLRRVLNDGYVPVEVGR